MLFNNIIVAYDGSENALAAAKKAREIAETDPKIKVHVTYVTTHPNAQLPANFNNESFDPQQYLLPVEDIIALYNKTIEEETTKVKDGIGDIFKGIEDQVTIDVVPGYTPAADILSHAKKVDADVIVMGSRGLGAIRGVIGSVSYAVLREAPIPVLVVK
jgi:nucleotide-binding universal stress UspA family protein